MPTYDYECSACGHKFEEFQSISAELLTKCPKCKKGIAANCSRFVPCLTCGLCVTCVPKITVKNNYTESVQWFAGVKRGRRL